MTAGHGRFEILCGAIALGEATAAERAEFARHASRCALCCGEPVDSNLLAAIGAQREAETWRPIVDDRVMTRIHEAQCRRSRFTVGLLGWAAAASIVINVFFVTGFAGKIGSAVLDAANAPPSVAATQYGIRLPAQTFARIQRRTLAGNRSHGTASAAGAPPQRGLMETQSPEFDPPDVFGGIDLAVRDPRAARAVAVDPRPLQLSP